MKYLRIHIMCQIFYFSELPELCLVIERIWGGSDVHAGNPE